MQLRPLMQLLQLTVMLHVCRFREEELYDDMAQWERKGDGIAPLAPDTEVVQNINEHRSGTRSLHTYFPPLFVPLSSLSSSTSSSPLPAVADTTEH